MVVVAGHLVAVVVDQFAVVVVKFGMVGVAEIGLVAHVVAREYAAVVAAADVVGQHFVDIDNFDVEKPLLDMLGIAH